MKNFDITNNNKVTLLSDLKHPRWYNDISILIKHPNEFVPSNELDDDRKVNAIARFSIYFAIYIIFMNRNQKWLAISVSILIISLFIGTTENFTNEHFNNSNNSKCVEPTKSNPFMNFTLSDYYKDADRPSNCPINTVRKDMKEKFLSRIEPDPADLWGQNISDRSFYTTPNTRIVNDQKGFAEWCYGEMGECKSEGKNCLKRALTRTSNGMFTSAI
jgi:hypothetical protein